MASKLKGLMIEISGNTTKLTQALADSRASIKETSEALKKVNEALKLDPKNIDLLNDKQNILNQMIDKTNHLLEVLRKGLGAVKDSNLGVDEKVQRIGIFDSQITGATADIVFFNKELENTNNAIENVDVKELADEVGDLGLEFNLGALASGDFFGAIKTNSPEAATAIALIGGSLSGLINDFKETARQIGEITKEMTAGIVSQLKGGIEFNAEIENYTVRLRNFQQVGEKADEVLKKLREDALKSPFDVGSLIQANALLLATGKEAEDVRKTINALGDAIASAGGSSDALERMAQNLQQISNNGKATAMDIRQFANAGIDVYGVLSELTGKTTQELKDMDITYELLSKALIKASEEGGKYFNGMGVMASTLNGRLSQLETKWKTVTGTIAEQTSGVFSDLVAQTNKALDDVITALENGDISQIGEIIKNWVTKCLDVIREELPAIISYITDIVSQVFSALSSPEIKESVVRTIETLLVVVKETMDTLYPQIKAIVKNISDAILTIVRDTEVRKTLVEIGSEAFAIIWDAFWYKLKTKLGGIGDFIGGLNISTSGYTSQLQGFEGKSVFKESPSPVTVINNNNVETNVDVEAISKKTAQQIRFATIMK